MTAKEYLGRLRILDSSINHKVKEIEDLREKLKSIKSVDYSKDRVQTSGSGEPSFVKTIEHIDELSRKINCEIDVFVDEKHKIINEIHKLKDVKHIDVLYKRYVEFKSLEEIAVEMNYVYGHLRRVHGEALKDFERCYKM